ncbi:MAG: peptidylprolyl isomerase, partial [Bacteroidetes bacterium]|nr:peptidylprolyl isomerase [Bacteroidota bacterium]
TNKYDLLVRKGLYVPAWQAEVDYMTNNTKASIQYVNIPYSSIADEDVTITDADLKDYISSHESKYEREETRNIEYVIYEVIPSKDDTETVRQFMLEQLEVFKTTNDDSSYLRLYSETREPPKYYSDEEIHPGPLTDTIFNCDSGTVIGPYLENGVFMMAKLMDTKEVPDSVSARHILFRVAQAEQYLPARNKIDSLAKAIEEGADFAEIAKEFSQDGSASEGGDLGWIYQGQMVAQFNDAIFYNMEIGQIKTVNSQFGIHIIELLEIKNPKPMVKLGYMISSVVASEETDHKSWAAGLDFSIKNKTIASFRKAAGSAIRSAENLAKNEINLLGLGTAREVIQWSFNQEVGDISDVKRVGDNYIVALLSTINEEGIPDLDEIRTEVQVEVMKEKKTELLNKQIQATNKSDIQALAAQFQKEVKSASDITFINPYITGVGSEPIVAATALGLKEKAISNAIRGETGVYFIMLESLTQPAPINDYSFNQKQLEKVFQGRASNLFDAVRKTADIVDNRYKFF